MVFFRKSIMREQGSRNFFCASCNFYETEQLRQEELVSNASCWMYDVANKRFPAGFMNNNNPISESIYYLFLVQPQPLSEFEFHLQQQQQQNWPWRRGGSHSAWPWYSSLPCNLQYSYCEVNGNTGADMTTITSSKEMEEEHLLLKVNQSVLRLSDPWPNLFRDI